MDENLRAYLHDDGLTVEDARSAIGQELIDSAHRGDRAALLETAADYLAALSLIDDKPTFGLWDWDIACGLLIDRGAEVKALLLRTLRHIDEDPPLDLPFADLNAEHLDACAGTLQPQALLRLLTRDWTPLPENALSRDIRSSGPYDMAVGIRSEANILAAFAAGDPGRARRALSLMERYGSAWPFDEERRFDLLAGALYAEAAKMGLLELPDRYGAFLDGATRLALAATSPEAPRTVGGESSATKETASMDPPAPLICPSCGANSWEISYPGLLKYRTVPGAVDEPRETSGDVEELIHFTCAVCGQSADGDLADALTEAARETFDEDGKIDWQSEPGH